MANDNMKKWLAVVADVPSTANTKGKMLTEDVTGALKDIHSKVLSRPEVSDTPDKVIARVAGGMRGVSKQEVQSGFDALSKQNGFSSFADELKSATGAHDEEMHVAESVVDEEDMEEGNEFSGALAAAKKQGKKSFEVDGKTYPVKESSDEEEEEEDEDMLSEEWSVLYDSTYATNMKASVRVQQGMNEEQVREWFSKAFQPLNIHEVSMRSPIDPKDQMSKPFVDPKQKDPMNALKPKPGKPKPDKPNPPHLMGEEQVDEILAPLAAGARAVGGAIAQGAKAVGSMAGRAVTGMANVAGQAVGAYKQGAQQQGVIGQQQQQAGQQQQQMPAAGGQPLKPGPIQVDTRKKMVITPVGAIPFTQMITKENRETRDDDLENEILTALSDIHEQLNGDYDLDKQYDVIHSVSESSGISYKDLLEAWVTDSHGMKQALAAAKQSSTEEQPPAEEPPAEQPPAEQPPAEEPTIGQAPPAEQPAEQPTIGQAPAAPPAEEPAPEEEPVIQPKAKVAESKKKKTKNVIKEAHNVMLDVHDDHEVSMAQADLYRIVKDASALHNMLDNVNDLEGWVQAKITLASDYISKVKDYMEYDMIEANRRNNDPYEDATLFETDDEDSADDADKDKIPHIVMQLRKAKDVDGNHKIKFEDGSSHYVSMTVIKNFLDKHDKMKPSQKDAMARDAIKSLRHLKSQAEI